MVTMRRVLLGIAPIMGVFGLLPAWYWSRPAPLQNPIASVPFDASHKGANAVAQVRIPQHRSWMVLVSFTTTRLDLATRLHLLHLFQDKDPIKVPIHLTLAKIGVDGTSITEIYDAVIDTIRPYSGRADSYETEVAAINLHPGLYRISVTAVDDTPELRRFSADLAVEYRAYVQFIPYAIVPRGG